MPIKYMKTNGTNIDYYRDTGAEKSIFDIISYSWLKKQIFVKNPRLLNYKKRT